MKLPKTYHEQNGCNNCDYTFVLMECEEQHRFFCTFDAPPPPVITKFDKWRDWEAGRRVRKAGVCDNWKLGDLWDWEKWEKAK